MKEEVLKQLTKSNIITGIMTIVASLLLYDEITETNSSQSLKWYYYEDAAINLAQSSSISSEVLLRIEKENYSSYNRSYDTLYHGPIIPSMVDEINSEFRGLAESKLTPMAFDDSRFNVSSNAKIVIDDRKITLSELPRNNATRRDIDIIAEDWWDSFEPIYNYIKKNQAY